MLPRPPGRMVTGLFRLQPRGGGFVKRSLVPLRVKLDGRAYLFYCAVGWTKELQI